jgi:hypothetical protein
VLHKTGCVASVGSGPNRLIARLATKRAKPDGAHHVSAATAAVFLAVLPAEDLPGVGRGTLDKLKRAGGVGGSGGGAGNTFSGRAGGGRGDEQESVLTCADIAATPLGLLQRALGEAAATGRTPVDPSVRTPPRWTGSAFDYEYVLTWPRRLWTDCFGSNPPRDNDDAGAYTILLNPKP